MSLLDPLRQIEKNRMDTLAKLEYDGLHESNSI